MDILALTRKNRSWPLSLVLPPSLQLSTTRSVASAILFSLSQVRVLWSKKIKRDRKIAGMFAQAATHVYQFLRELHGTLFQRRYVFDFDFSSSFACKERAQEQERDRCLRRVDTSTLYHSPVCLVLRRSLCIMIAYAFWNSRNFITPVSLRVWWKCVWRIIDKPWNTVWL